MDVFVFKICFAFFLTEESSLPSVPPLRLIVPCAYPKEGPEWMSLNPESDSEDSTEVLKASSNPSFLDRLKPKMETHINNVMDHNETISAILTAWERSVKETISSQRQVIT